MSTRTDPDPRERLREFGAALVVQQRVVVALLLREILTRFGRHNIGFLWLFVEPMLFTLGITALWTATQAVHGSDLPIVAFAVTGYSTVLLWRNMPNRCIGSVQPNLSLMFHRQIKVIDIFAARILLEAGGATMSFTVLIVIFSSIGWLELPEDVLKVALAWAMTAWFGASLAITLGALSEKSEVVDKLWHPSAYLLFPLSGAAFMVDALPRTAQQVVLWLPMVHGVELLREGFFGSQFRAHYDLGYMALCCTALTLIGLALTRQVSREVVPE